MAKGRRDVDLVIRAKNEASKAIDQVSAALTELTKAQGKAGTGAGKAGALLSELGAELGKLTAKANGASVFDRLAGSVQKAEAAVSRLEGSVASAAQNQQKLGQEVQQSEAAVAGFVAKSEQLSAELAQQKARTTEARQAQTEFNASMRQAASEQAKAQTAYDKLGAAYDKQLAKVNAIAKAQNAAADAIEKAENPTARQFQTAERLGASYDKQKAKLDQLAQAYIQSGDNLDQSVVKLQKMEAESEKIGASFQQQKDAQAQAAQALRQVQEQAGAAAGNLTRLRQAEAAATSAVSQQNAALDAARTELAAVAATGNDANAVLGKIGATIRQQLLRALADGTDQLKAFKQQWDSSTAQVGPLASRAAQLRSSVNTSPEAQSSADTATQAAIASARAAKQAYTEQQQALQVLRNALRSAGTDVQALGVLMNGDTDAARRFQAALQSVTSANQQTGAAAAQAASAAQRQGAAASAAASSTSSAAAAVRETGNASSDAAGKTNTFAATLALLSGNSRQALSFTQRLRGQLLSLAASYVSFFGAIQGIGGVIGTYQQVEAAQSKLGVVFNQDSAKVAQAMAFIRKAADDLGLSFADLANQYASFAVSTKGTAIEGAETQKAFLSVAKAVRVYKLSTDDANGAFLALSQMASKGTVSMEELRQQLGDRLPGALHVLAVSMGLTDAELNKLVASAGLASEDAIPRLAAGLEKLVGPQLAASLTSLTSQIGFFKNEIQKAQIEVAQGGLVDGLRDGLTTLNTFFKSDDGKKFFQNLGAAAGATLKVLAQIPKYADQIVTVLSVLVGIKASKWAQALAADFLLLLGRVRAMPAAVAASNAAMAASTSGATGLRGAIDVLGTAYFGLRSRVALAGQAFVASVTNFSLARVAASALTGSLALLRGALAALGGIPGLVITGVTLILGQWLTSADDATDALDKHRSMVDKVREAYENAKGSAADWGKTIQNTSAIEIQLNTKKLQDQLLDLRKDFLPNGAADAFGLDQQGTAGKINDLVSAFRAGTLGAKDFRDGLAELAKTDQSFGQSPLLEQMVEVSRKAQDLETSIGEGNAAVRALSGTASDADKALLGLKDSQGDVGDAAASTTGNLDKQTEALKKLIPSLDNATQRAAELQKIDLIQRVVDTSPIDKASKAYLDFTKLVQQARAEVNKKFDDQQITGGLVDRIVGAESGGVATAKNPNSTATGLGQFIESTWLNLFKKYFPSEAASMTEDQILDLRKNADLSRKMIELYARENADLIQQATGSVSDAAVYLAHFLGPQGAIKLLKASADTPVSSLLSPDQIKANRSVLQGKTAGDVIGWAQGKVGTSDQEVAAAKTLVELREKQAQTAADYHEKLSQDLEVMTAQNAVAKERTLQEEVNVALLKAQNDAKKAGTTLTDDEVKRITDATTQLYNQKHAQDELNAAKAKAAADSKNVDALENQRQGLLDRINYAKQTGDTNTVDDLTGKYNELTTAIQAAIQAKIDYWKPLAGQDGEIGDLADQQLAKYQKLYDATVRLKTQAEQIGPTYENIGKALGGGLSSAISNFASQVQQTGDLFGSLKTAFQQFASDFLIQIANMILKQLTFNALQAAAAAAFGGGYGSLFGSAASALAGSFHVGGVVGAGGGNSGSRSVAAGWFANAARYHTGGIAGLAPNEVPAILQKGEEVLTASDPRHVGNGGGQSPVNLKVVNAIDSVSVVSAALAGAPGTRTMINFMKSNKGAVKSALGL